MIVQVGADEFDSGPHQDVRALAAAANRADNVVNLNEQARLELKHRGLQKSRLWLAREGAEAAGFALLHGENLDLAVHPGHRGNGIGTALAAAALAGLEQVDAWSHADHPAAARLAARFGVPRARELIVMSRPTSLAVEQPTPSEGVALRTFEPGDTAAVVAVNGRAFAHHAEQGDLTEADFDERVGEAWFDPRGLILAVDTASGEVLGFHWTKVHRDGDDTEPPYGEVYVVAVDPGHEGRGLGTALTRAGLLHLATTGVDRVILYVDGDNAAALAVYRRQGFAQVRAEAQYRGRPQPL